MSKIDLPTLDRRIDSLTPWIHKAGNSLRGFYNPETGTFWRDTFGMRVGKGGLHPTSTNRSFFALSEYLRFLYEESSPGRNNLVCQQTVEVLDGVAHKYLRLLIDNPSSARASTSNGENIFTDSHLLISASLVEQLAKVSGAGTESTAIRSAAQNSLVNDIQERLKKWKGGKIAEGDEVHDFLTLYAVRGLDIFSGQNAFSSELECSIRERAKQDVLRMLAYFSAGVRSEFDPTEIIFSISLLNRFPTPGSSQLTDLSIKSVADCQSEDGGWPPARFVSYEGKGLLHVASYEVALALTDLSIKQLDKGNIQFCKNVFGTLERAFSLVRSHYNIFDAMSGWANDHARRVGLLESWATAIVLVFLIHYRDFLLELRQRLVLQAYNIRTVDSPTESHSWPDLVPGFRQANQMNWSALDSISDPTDQEALTKAIKEAVARPIAESWIHRPKLASILLYGPPGSRKTSLVIGLAEVLRWPTLILSPPDFLRNGLEGFEASAANIFVDLTRLRRVVVLFDECEEFFKRRPEGNTQQVERRTIGAFITAGMLPRLQMLREKRWILIVFSTNSDLEELDPAATRTGRVDVVEEIRHPTLEAQIRYVSRKVDDRGRQSIIQDALERYDKVPNKVGDISFSILDQLIEKLLVIRKDVSADIVLKDLTEFVKGPPRLTET